MSSCHAASIQYDRHLIPLFYIWSSGYNLNILLFSHIYLADDQFVRIWMGFNFFNLSDDDSLQVCIHPLKSFYLGAGQSHGIREFLGRHIKFRHICFYP